MSAATQVLDAITGKPRPPIKFTTILSVCCTWCENQAQFIGDSKAETRRAAKHIGWTVSVTKDGGARCPEHRWKKERP
jgi:hypothetical protein